MYRQNQIKAKDYIVESLNQISSDWKFDIDAGNNPNILGYNLGRLVINAKIENIHMYLTQELVDNIGKIYDIHHYDAKVWVGGLLLRQWIIYILQIYGINVLHCKYVRPADFRIMSMDKTREIGSNIWYYCLCDKNKINLITPFDDYSQVELLRKEEIVPPILLLLDPLEYFKRYFIIIKKYPQLNKGHTLGIYELLLGYFPEMNEELTARYLVLYCIFKNVCPDMILVIGTFLVSLYNRVI